MVLSIVGLEISVPQLIWTIINFFILFFVLKGLLFKPMLRFMDERKAKIKAGLQEGADARKELEAQQTVFASELDQSRIDARNVILDAQSEAEEQRAAVIKAATEQAASEAEVIKEKIAKEESDVRADMSEHMAEYVSALTNQLLGQEATSQNADVVRRALTGEGA